MAIETETRKFWDNQPLVHENPELVNIADIFQRDIEYEFVTKHLKPDHVTLEVGCGNGFSSQLFRKYVKHLDAFDQSNNMIESAKKLHGETNNRFFIDDVTNLNLADNTYDTVINVRVLINLANLDEQKQSLNELFRVLKPKGQLIFIEGFKDGFEHLSAARRELNMPEVEPAKINFYSHLNDLKSIIDEKGQIVDEFDSGTYDYYTRIIYPYLVGLENIDKQEDVKKKLTVLALRKRLKELSPHSRLKGFVVIKK
jgi:ubiquinone/menaquinone biosynthesis C-methylase UbiE